MSDLTLLEVGMPDTFLIDSPQQLKNIIERILSQYIHRGIPWTTPWKFVVPSTTSGSYVILDVSPDFIMDFRSIYMDSTYKKMFDFLQKEADERITVKEYKDIPTPTIIDILLENKII